MLEVNNLKFTDTLCIKNIYKDNKGDGSQVSSKKLTLYFDTLGEFALPARDFSVAASVSGWHNRLQLFRLAALGCSVRDV